MCFYSLLLGHLLGDFTFQTDKIAENKTKIRKWNLLHSAVVTASMLIFSFPFGLIIITFVLLNGIAHFFIDQFKSKLPVKNSVHAFIYFIGDQLVHIFFIYLISRFSNGNAGILFFDDKTLKFFVILLLVVSFASVLNQYILRFIFPACSSKFFFKNEKIIGSITRALIFFIIFFSFNISSLLLLAIPVFVAFNILYYNKIWYKWLDLKYFYVRLLMDLAVPAIGYYLLKIT
ncbi:MAG: DUF3307 domain-containing protein [Firmicutes bacterium]|nr:DUF3307 domain-containing protein [Bacillota bacterium]